MPGTETKTEAQEQVGVSRLVKLGVADVERLSGDDRRAGESTSAGAAQSKTTDGVGDAGVEDDDRAGDQEDDTQGSDEETEEGSEEDESGEEESEEDESGEDKGDDEVELPEPVAKIVDTLEKTDPESAKELRATVADSMRLAETAESVIQAEAGTYALFEALTSPETAGKALPASLDWLAKQRGISVSEMMLEAGFVAAPKDGTTPAFLEESNHSSLIDEVLKDGNFEEGAGLEDAKLGAEMMLKHLIGELPQALPADYHGEYQEFKKSRQQSQEAEAAKAEATKVAKSNYAKVRQMVAWNYEGYALTEAQAIQAAEALPQLVKDADTMFKAVVATFHKELNGALRKSTQKREKKRMRPTPGGGEHKPKAQSGFEFGKKRGLSVRDAIPQ